MKLLRLMPFAVAAFVSAPAMAQSPSSLIVLKLSGGYGWSVECMFEREGKEPLTINRTGRGRSRIGSGRSASIAAENVTGGSCEYEGPPRSGQLKIEFEDKSFPEKCPFTLERSVCVGRFDSGSSGRFSF